MAHCCLTCPIAAHWGGHTSSQLSHCHSLMWLCYLRRAIATHWHGPALSQVSHTCTLRWVCIVPGTQLKLSDVVLHYLKCPTFPHWAGFMLFKVSHWCSLEWLCIISDFHCCSLGMALCHPRYTVLLTELTPVSSSETPGMMQSYPNKWHMDT